MPCGGFPGGVYYKQAAWRMGTWPIVKDFDNGETEKKDKSQGRHNLQGNSLKDRYGLIYNTSLAQATRTGDKGFGGLWFRTFRNFYEKQNAQVELSVC